MAIQDTGLQPLNYFMTVSPFVASSAIVSARIWKKILERNVAADDVLIIIAQILAAGLTVSTCIFIKVSFTGYRAEEIPRDALDMVETAKWRFINVLLYNPILTLIKVSFITTLIKLGSPSIWIKTSLWTLFTASVLFGLATSTITVLNCRPISKTWDYTIPGICIHTPFYIYGTLSALLLTDALVSVVPFFILYGLQMPRRTKALVISFLSLGLVVTAITSYRLSTFVRLFSMENPIQGESPYNVRTPLANIEAGLAGIAACGPTLKYILGLMIPSLRSSSDKARHTTPACNISSLKKRRRAETDSDLSTIARWSVFELTDTLDWRFTDGIKSLDVLEQEHEFVGTGATSTNGRADRGSYERPTSLV